VSDNVDLARVRKGIWNLSVGSALPSVGTFSSVTACWRKVPTDGKAEPTDKED
jgi:hypothetical protein